MNAVTQLEIDQRVYDLYDEYCHGRIDRREFLRRAGALGLLASALALLPDYAKAQQVSFTDPRIKASYVTYPSPGGNAQTMRGYLVQPSAGGRASLHTFPAVLVIHENRGLNPYVEDVARRAALAGFLALAPDGLAPLGGYPGNDDDGREMQAKLDQAKLRTDMLNGARWLKAHDLSNGKLGATGFCWGGGTTNFLATALGGDLQAAAPFYGAAACKSPPIAVASQLVVPPPQQKPVAPSFWLESMCAFTNFAPFSMSTRSFDWSSFACISRPSSSLPG